MPPWPSNGWTSKLRLKVESHCKADLADQGQLMALILGVRCWHKNLHATIKALRWHLTCACVE